MKIAGVKEVKDKLSYYLKAAEKEDVILMKNGRPTAVLHHLGDDVMKDYILEHDPKFRAKIEKRWKAYLRVGGRSIQDVLSKGVRLSAPNQKPMATSSARGGINSILMHSQRTR
jgi:hypothetical protein